MFLLVKWERVSKSSLLKGTKECSANFRDMSLNLCHCSCIVTMHESSNIMRKQNEELDLPIAIKINIIICD